MPNVDWDVIRAEYLQGRTSHRKLADKYGISYATIRRRAEKEHWTSLLKDVERKASAKAAQKIVSQRAKDMAILDESRSMLIAKLKKSIEGFPDIPGNRMEQTATEVSGISELKDSGDKIHYVPRQKIVKFESDLLKMVTALDKLMELTGYSISDDSNQDDGFIDALQAVSTEVTDDAADTPDDVDTE